MGLTGLFKAARENPPKVFGASAQSFRSNVKRRRNWEHEKSLPAVSLEAAPCDFAIATRWQSNSVFDLLVRRVMPS